MLAFTTGIKNEVSAAVVGQTVAEQFRDDIVAHAAWELVEEYTASSGAVTWYVFKCLAAQSGLSADFYAVIGRTIATGELRFAICEGYNAGTHTMSRFAAVSTGSNVVYDAVGANPNTQVLGTAAFAGTANTPKYMTWTPAGVSAKWALIVSEDGFTAFWGGLNEAFVTLGAYIPLSVQTNLLPLNIQGLNGGTGGVTRNPAVVSATVVGLALECKGGGTSSMDGEVLGFRPDIRYKDHLQGDVGLVAEVGMIMYQNTATSMETYGYAIGKQKRMRYGGGSQPTGFAWGDSYELDGTLWVPYRPQDLRLYDTGVAA